MIYVIYYYNFTNLEETKASVFYDTEIRFIQFHFCLSGNLSFGYNNGAYSFPLKKDSSILLFNPSTILPVDVIMSKNSRLISILISIKKFHSLFSETSDSISFLSNENIDKKYYKESKVSPLIATILTQMLNEKTSDSVRKLYIKGKVFELYVKGYAIEQIAGYKYWYKGTKIIGWRRNILDRKTLKLNVDRATCRLSNRQGIINFLNQIIYRAKKENKL